ncbi:MAG: type II toxin-antitoxin system HicB family antitoxin [Aridibacter sp.]
MEYPFVIYPAEEGGYVAEVPSLKGCLAQGETLEETLSELRIVTNLWIESALDNGEKLPNTKLEIENFKKKISSLEII